jgi:medium-chain acyl-[acyl-carrier-protein] hydrolase
VTGRVKLCCLPYAGGSARTFRRFRRYLDPGIDIVPLDPPAHGERIDEAPIPSYDGMADDLFSRFQGELSERATRFAFFGHSMGASLAFLLTERLAAAGLSAPFHLFVSGSTGPAVSSRFKNLHRLPDDEFISAVKALGGLRDTHLFPKELLDLFLPVLRSDFRAASDFELDASRLGLMVPITAFLGGDDLITSGQEDAWQQIAGDRYRRLVYPGGHFFFLDHVRPIAETINDICR